MARAGQGEADARLAAALLAHRVILFDLDDTLCDYSTARRDRLRRAFSDALRTSGVTPPGDGLERLIDESIAAHPHGTDHFPELLSSQRATPEAIEAAQEWFRSNPLLGLEFFPEATAALAAVRAQPVPGRRLGIITNGPGEIQRRKVEQLGVAPLVDVLVISGEFGAHKPDPAIFREALRRAGATADEALYVGDSPEFDVAGARGAGLTPVWVNRGGGPWCGDGPVPDLVVRDIGQVLRAAAPRAIAT